MTGESSPEPFELPELVDLKSEVDVLTGWTAFSTVSGTLWLKDERLGFARKKEAGGDATFECLFDAPLNTLKLRWARKRHAVRVYAGGKRFRVHFQGDLYFPKYTPIFDIISGVAGLQALKGSKNVLGQYLDYRAAREVGLVWFEVLGKLGDN